MKGKKNFTQAEAEQIKALIVKKLKADATEQKSIRNKIRKLGFFASDFGLRGGYTVNDFLRYITIAGGAVSTTSPSVIKNSITPKIKQSDAKRRDSDETYIISICDEILNEESLKQHRFNFLRGDSGVMLPVDAYYPNHNLVIEFMEKQHSEPVKFFDKKQTVSGVGRGEQRKIYDERRKELIPKNGINFITFSYNEFEHKSNKRLVRNIESDKEIIKNKLKKFNEL